MSKLRVIVYLGFVSYSTLFLGYTHNFLWSLGSLFDAWMNPTFGIDIFYISQSSFPTCTCIQSLLLNRPIWLFGICWTNLLNIFLQVGITAITPQCQLVQHILVRQHILKYGHLEVKPRRELERSTLQRDIKESTTTSLVYPCRRIILFPESLRGLQYRVFVNQI